MKKYLFIFYLIAALIIAVPVFAGMKGVSLTTVFNSLLNAPGYMSGGTKFTTSGCSISATTGGATAGTYTSGTTGTCTAVITMNGATGLTATNGWTCFANDETTVADKQQTTAHSATTATIAGTTVSGDVVSFACNGY